MTLNISWTNPPDFLQNILCRRHCFGFFSYFTYSALKDQALKQPLQIFNGINLPKPDRYFRLPWFLLPKSALLFIFLLSLNWVKIYVPFVPWTSTMMSGSWKANSFQDSSLIRNQWKMKMGTFFMHGAKLKQLSMSSKDETFAHTKATGTWPTVDKGTTCWHLLFCWLPYCPALSLYPLFFGRETAASKIHLDIPCSYSKGFFRYLSFQLHFWVMGSWSEISQLVFLPITPFGNVFFLFSSRTDFPFNFTQNSRKQ